MKSPQRTPTSPNQHIAPLPNHNLPQNNHNKYGLTLQPQSSTTKQEIQWSIVTSSSPQQPNQPGSILLPTNLDTCGLLRVTVDIVAMLHKNEIEEEWTFPLLFDKIMTIRNELLRYIGCQSQWQLIVIIYRDTGWPLGPRLMLEPVSLGESEVNVQIPGSSGSWLCSYKK